MQLTMNAQRSRLAVTHRGGVHSGGGRCHSCGRDGTASSLSGPGAHNQSALQLWWEKYGKSSKYAERRFFKFLCIAMRGKCHVEGGCFAIICEKKIRTRDS